MKYRISPTLGTLMHKSMDLRLPGQYTIITDEHSALYPGFEDPIISLERYKRHMINLFATIQLGVKHF